ncbi:hypothetical protein A0127_05490 [Thermococcus peptonophilus]|uniref:Uncharacterized protein n=1 Tax=Thermococcus peptonophilus TaxID=53952 RepID=A0A142CV57_9EURY|nr:hypothetical protein A0127_05490 [Thermococcus peptonophilus]
MKIVLEFSSTKMILTVSLLMIFPFLIDGFIRKDSKLLFLGLGVLSAYLFVTLFLVFLDVLIAKFSSAFQIQAGLKSSLFFALYFIFTIHNLHLPIY